MTGNGGPWPDQGDVSEDWWTHEDDRRRFEALRDGAARWEVARALALLKDAK